MDGASVAEGEGRDQQVRVMHLLADAIAPDRCRAGPGHLRARIGCPEVLQILGPDHRGNPMPAASQVHRPLSDPRFVDDVDETRSWSATGMSVMRPCRIRRDERLGGAERLDD